MTELDTRLTGSRMGKPPEHEDLEECFEVTGTDLRRGLKAHQQQ